MLFNFVNFLNIKFPFENTIISFLLWIDALGYKIFSILYKTFLKLAQQEIFKEDAFETIYNNIYIIIGVVALFMLSWMLLRIMINPEENKGSKEIKDMIIRFVMSVCLIVLLPTFFTFLRYFQNSLLEYNVVPKILLDNQIAIQQVDENGNYIGDQELIDPNDINLTTEVMQYRANEMVASLISGLMYPLKTDKASYDGEPADKVFDEELGTYRYYNSDGKEWSTNVSKWWDGSAKQNTFNVGCAVGAAGLVILTVVTAGWGSVLTIGLGTAGMACLAGGGVSYLGGSVVASVTAKSYTWTNALQAITLQSNYTQISLFAKAITDGTFHYTPILSTIVVGILVYLMIGFCIDVVVRQAKLVFYQLLAPLCFLISVNPKSRDLMGKWFKLVFTCWIEIFTRVVLLCAVVLLVGKLDLDRLTTIFHPIISTFIILGIVTFAKQIPKIISDVTGFDSGKMNLNLKEKLKEGSFGLSGAVGTLGRKTIAGIDAKRNGYNFKDGWKSIEGAGPFSKVKKGFYGMLPYTAKSIEKTRAASEQAKEIETRVKKGKELLAKYHGSGDYIESLEGQQYDVLKNAYKNRKKSKEEMLSYQAELEAARASGDRERISLASKNYNEAKDKYDSYDNEFKQILNSSKFSKIGKNYADMKYVEDREKEIPSIETYRQNSNSGYQATRQVNRTNSNQVINQSSDVNKVKYTTEKEYNSDSTGPTIIIPNDARINVSEIKNNVKTQEVSGDRKESSKPLSELENLNRQKKEIEDQIKSERNSKYLEEAQQELNEINRKIDNLNNKGEK